LKSKSDEKILAITPEVQKRASEYFEVNKDILELLRIDSPDELINRLLYIPNAKKSI
jgi:hypothetical protein